MGRAPASRRVIRGGRRGAPGRGRRGLRARRVVRGGGRRRDARRGSRRGSSREPRAPEGGGVREGRGGAARGAARGRGPARLVLRGEQRRLRGGAELGAPSDPGWFRAEANPPAAGVAGVVGAPGTRTRGAGGASRPRRGRRASRARASAPRSRGQRKTNGRTPTWPPGDARRGSAACPRTPTREAPCPAAWTRGKSEATSSSARTCAAAGREVPSRARDASEKMPRRSAPGAVYSSVRAPATAAKL